MGYRHLGKGLNGASVKNVKKLQNVLITFHHPKSSYYHYHQPLPVSGFLLINMTYKGTECPLYVVMSFALVKKPIHVPSFRPSASAANWVGAQWISLLWPLEAFRNSRLRHRTMKKLTKNIRHFLGEEGGRTETRNAKKTRNAAVKSQYRAKNTKMTTILAFLFLKQLTGKRGSKHLANP